jgi:hypothetical protein
MKRLLRIAFGGMYGISLLKAHAGTVSERSYSYTAYSQQWHDLPLAGQASGGVLYCVSNGDPERSFCSIRTISGESAATVLRRLAEKIYTPPGQLAGGGEAGLMSGEIHIDPVRGLMMPADPSAYVLAGTETGLGIPRAPLFLSGSYDAVRGELVYHWENPPGEYDVVIIGPSPYFDTNTTSRVLSKALYRFGEPPYEGSIVALRGKTPSNIGFINVSSNAQEELRSGPFTGGVMPNWMSWVRARGGANAAVFEQGARPCGNFGERPFTPDGKPFYQIVKTKIADAHAGIWRKWLGLHPGHKYRVYVRLNTMAMDKSPDAWSLSFHATPNAPGGVALTTEQLAGLAPLPDGSKGAEAGRMVWYGPGNTTKGAWVTNTVDIVLPSGVDTITTWLRHSGADSTGVGMDWIKVEDLSGR